MRGGILVIFLFPFLSFGDRFAWGRKICNVLQFGSYALASSKENRRHFKYAVVGIIDPFDKNRVLWSRQKRHKKFNLDIFKNLYDKFFCNVNDYVYLRHGDDFIFRIFHINLKNTIKYMLKYKIVSGTLKEDSKGDANILCVKERSPLYRFLNNVNL
ncbi:hypothetical protein C922_02272 [Plasmodium inui San Antonio 1]|uniref:Uncharacterized protein n=1 Tax=Plasmodium inui San Antonio 1 TaxID=1237626 RepID=W7A1P0_9APIC|nr:hypothetical protein C922_02272 [Plasmodium inui San Antonio 1]EUD67122.1 hypothetical protein C922_02272 [Plasmodium inui San Antonio 1]